MNMRRFTGRNAREALNKVREAFGEDAIVLSNKPCPGGVEILAMPPQDLESIEQRAAEEQAERVVSRPAATAARPKAVDVAPADTVQDDVKRLAMSTLSFQDYVRERLLKRRQAALGKGESARAEPPPHIEPSFDLPVRDEAPAQALAQRLAQRAQERAQAQVQQGPLAGSARPAGQMSLPRREPPLLREELPAAAPHTVSVVSHAAAQGRDAATAPARPHDPAQGHPPAVQAGASDPAWAAQAPSLADTGAQPVQAPVQAGVPPTAPAARPPQPGSAMSAEMMQELRTVKGLIEERFGAIAFLEKLQRSRSNAQLAQKLLDCGFSPALIRKLLDAMPPEVSDGSADETAWASEVLERNLLTGEHDLAVEDQGGAFALVGSTGVGKTTSTAKIAAAFAAKHGAANLGLITLDAYRVGAHEQLRAYGRILGVPVHTAHDRATLDDLLDLLAAKKLILIDTAGIAQRDTRARELLDMLSPRIRRLLVVNAAAQGETIDDVLVSFQAGAAAGIVLSKMDEAVKLGPALDALIRHRLKVVGVANGQRVPEDWHRLSSRALVHRALRSGGSPAYRLDPNEVNLVFTTSSASPAAMAAQMQAHAQAHAHTQFTAQARQAEAVRRAAL